MIIELGSVTEETKGRFCGSFAEVCNNVIVPWNEFPFPC